MEEYLIEKTNEQKLGGDYKEVTLRIDSKNNGKVDMERIGDIYDDLERYLGHDDFLLRAQGITRMTTLKGYDEELNLLSYEEYFRGKVKNEEKFNNFLFLEVTFIK